MTTDTPTRPDAPRCVFVSEIPVGYRTGWFRHLHEDPRIDLGVIYLAEGQSDRPWEVSDDRSDPWASAVPSLRLGSTARGHFPRLNPGLGRALTKASPDVVLLPGWAHPACWQATVWCKLHRVPYAVMAETWKPQAETRLPQSITNAVRSTVLRGASLTLPVGVRAQRYLSSLGAPNVQLVHGNTCDSTAIAEQSVGSVERAPRTVAYVGRLMEHKGAAMLPVLAAALNEHGIHLAVVGDGPLQAEVNAATSAGRGSFHGSLAPHEAQRVMAQSDAVVVPSKKEPWGVVAHEALACGTPVVASTEVGSAEDLLTSPVVGVIVEPRVESLVGALVATVDRAAKDREAVADACRVAATRISYSTATDELTAALATIGLGR